MTYKTFTIWASFDKGTTGKSFSVVAISADAAIQDIKEAYGECLILSQDMGR
jgi:hypothetical protein